MSWNPPALSDPMSPPKVSVTASQGETVKRYVGKVKSFVTITGFGFIDCEEAKREYGRDVFLHKMQAVGVTVGQPVEFEVYVNSNGMPQARNVVNIAPKNEPSLPLSLPLPQFPSPAPSPSQQGHPPPRSPIRSPLHLSSSTEQDWLVSSCSSLNTTQRGAEGVPLSPAVSPSKSRGANKNARRRKSPTPVASSTPTPTATPTPTPYRIGIETVLSPQHLPLSPMPSQPQSLRVPSSMLLTPTTSWQTLQTSQTSHAPSSSGWVREDDASTTASAYDDEILSCGDEDPPPPLLDDEETDAPPAGIPTKAPLNSWAIPRPATTAPPNPETRRGDKAPMVLVPPQPYMVYVIPSLPPSPLATASEAITKN